jgi:hypothetical protein
LLTHSYSHALLELLDRTLPLFHLSAHLLCCCFLPDSYSQALLVLLDRALPFFHLSAHLLCCCSLPVHGRDREGSKPQRHGEHHQEQEADHAAGRHSR